MAGQARVALLRWGFSERTQEKPLAPQAIRIIEGTKYEWESGIKVIQGFTETQSSRFVAGTVCAPPQIQGNIIVTPKQPSYRIGEMVSLACPPGSTLEGHSEITCDPSLQWPQDVNTIRCNTASEVTGAPETLQCTPWEKIKNGVCVCKMPYECSSSLPVCGMNIKSRQTILLTLCKLLAMECLGRRFEIITESDCQPSVPSAAKCGSCAPWEKCNAQQGRCVCKAAEECIPFDGGIRFCALMEGSEVEETVSECLAGVWRCRGKAYRVITSHPCSHQSAVTSVDG
ncbi:complement component C7-like [Scyliorhinus torazame]|uniref:complement component C7-like n=1 Tax=Scyliorhinus torazame TaxID=75743 RepID=UPI003B59BA18